MSVTFPTPLTLYVPTNFTLHLLNAEEQARFLEAALEALVCQQSGMEVRLPAHVANGMIRCLGDLAERLRELGTSIEEKEAGHA